MSFSFCPSQWLSTLKGIINILPVKLACSADPELQIREGTKDNSMIIFLISEQNICCDPSLEPSP